MSTSNPPFVQPARILDSGWRSLTAWASLPGLGSLPVNSFVLDGPEPMLVDTNLAAAADTFMNEVDAVVGFARLKWIWLSHMDWDHIGNLRHVLAAAPQATVITNGLGMAKLGLVDIAPRNVRLVDFGDTIDIADRRLTAMRPVYYDAPETMGFYDETGRALFVGDSFGALFQGELDKLEDADEAALAQGMTLWSQVDAPWLGDQSPATLAGKLRQLERIDPRIVMSAHLPAAGRVTPRLTGIVGRAYGAVAQLEAA